MIGFIEFIVLSVLTTLLSVAIAIKHRSHGQHKPAVRRVRSWLGSAVSRLWARQKDIFSPDQLNPRHLLQEIHNLAECHETASLLANLIRKDGAGEWPPRSNHDRDTWPAPLQAYRAIYEEMLPLLAVAEPSLDDNVNREQIMAFRARFRALLRERVDLPAVERLLQAAEAGQWDVFPRDTYNGFYACVAWCRHAYRWGTIPVIRIAQLERTVDLPRELVLPWTYQQRHFGLTSDSGNNMSNLVLNFTPSGRYSLRINDPASQSTTITRSEEAFSRIFYDVERFALPVYHAIIHALRARSLGDMPTCLYHVRRITHQLRPVLSSYYERVHDETIARSAWLSHVQGFFGWGAGYYEPGHQEGGVEQEEPQWVKFDGLSGNQVLLFQVLDAFLGLPAYLDEETQRRNVPAMQRELVRAVARHCFRAGLGKDGVDGLIAEEMREILKRLRLFRTAHRTRAKVYLTQPAPERLPMTAGKSLLKSDIETSLEYLDGFMLGRLAQTV
ncbi:hypothetical protein VTJ04DRAFT_2040 [Mycothermus thermophilus]|uniref:uncharacterized protein n=1 Tax=Humicola insolens TaxID=85995 RepID=UPI003743DEF5